MNHRLQKKTKFRSRGACTCSRLQGCIPTKTRRRARGGQAIVEFVVVMGVLLALVAMLSLFLEVQREHGDRVLRLVASEYP